MSTHSPPSFASSTFVTSSLPDFHPNDLFIVACTIPADDAFAPQNSLRFHIAEFATFKYLIQCLKPELTPYFLSSYMPNAQYLNYGGKNVLQGLYSPQFEADARIPEVEFQPYVRTEMENGKMKRVYPGAVFDDLRYQIKKGGIRVRVKGDKSVRLTIVICGPTSVQQDVLQNREWPIPKSSDYRPDFLTVDEIRKLIGPGVHSMLVTPNMFGAGWVVNPSFTTAERQGVLNFTTEMNRRAGCNIAPLIAKDIRLDLLRDVVRSSVSDPDTFSRLDEGLKPELSALRNASERGSLAFFFEPAPFSEINLSTGNDNWSHFVAGGRRFPLVEHEMHWHHLGAAFPEGPEAYNFDHLMIREHLQVLAFVQRNDWLSEPDEEKRARLLDVAKYLELESTELHATPSESKAGIPTRFRPKRQIITLLSPYRLACHNLADLMVEMNPGNPAYDPSQPSRSLGYTSAIPSASSGNLDENIDNLIAEFHPLSVSIAKHPLSMDKRLEYFRGLFFAPIHSEFLDDKASVLDGPGSGLSHIRRNFIKSVYRSDRPLNYVAEVLTVPSTYKELKTSGIDVRPKFLEVCKNAARRDKGIQQACQNLETAFNREVGEEQEE